MKANVNFVNCDAKQLLFSSSPTDFAKCAKNELFETTDCIIAPFHSQCERLHSLFFFVKNYFIILWQFMKNSCFRKYYNLYLTEKLHRL